MTILAVPIRTIEIQDAHSVALTVINYKEVFQIQDVGLVGKLFFVSQRFRT